jgi:hypothetical protein
VTDKPDKESAASGLRPGTPLAGLLPGPAASPSGNAAQTVAGLQSLQPPDKPPKPPRRKDASGRYLPNDTPPTSKSGRYQRKRKELGLPTAKGLVGVRGNVGPDPGRARRALNLATIAAMQDAFDRGGQKAIDKVMTEQPALFLKMLVLLVPRELAIEHSGSIKSMTDEALEASIDALQRLIAGGKLIEGRAEDVSASQR